MSILQRYLARELGKPCLIIVTILNTIFLIYSSVHFLEDVAIGSLPTETLLPLILLKVLIAQEVILPIAFYLSGIYIFSTMHSANETAAMFSCGIGPRQLLIPLAWLSLALALLVAGLSLFIRPWAYQMTYQFKALAHTQYGLEKMEPGQFVEGGNEDEIYFIGQKNSSQKAETVFIQRTEKNRVQVFFARKARQIKNNSSVTGRKFLLLDGTMSILEPNRSQDLISSFERCTIYIGPPQSPQLERKAKTTNTFKLLGSRRPKEVAELQWRFTAPIMTFLFGLICLPLSSLRPQWGRYGNVVMAMLIYAVYYNLQSMAETWVEHSSLAFFPGTWWTTALLAALLGILCLRRNSYLGF